MKKDKNQELAFKLALFLTVVACCSSIGHKKNKVYEGKIVEVSEIKTEKENCFYFYIDRNGNESNFENILEVDEEILTESSIADQLKEGSQLKYKAGRAARIYLKDILEIDGVKTR